MWGIVLMLHVANVACCTIHGENKIIIMVELPVRIVSVSELKQSTFVISQANFFLMFYCLFPEKHYICSTSASSGDADCPREY